MSKFSSAIKSTYRHAHLLATTTVESMTSLDGFLSFGGTACPPQWSCISKTICDLAKDLVACSEWDHQELHSPVQAKIPLPLTLSVEVPEPQQHLPKQCTQVSPFELIL